VGTRRTIRLSLAWALLGLVGAAPGAVVMTAFSAKVDEHSQRFYTPLPGRPDDVFGIRMSEFYRQSALPEVSFEGGTLKASIDFYAFSRQ